MTKLIVHPRESVSFEEFCSQSAPAVALDGYVEGPTRWSRGGSHANFDHHGMVDRFSTRATCEQVALAIRSRFGLVVTPEGTPRTDLMIHVNDPDPDVSLSCWLLRHTDAHDHPAVRALVELEGAVDSTGGTTVPGGPAALEILAWVSDPWAANRDLIPVMSGADMEAIIDECGLRIDAVLEGHPERLSLDHSYETIEESAGVVAVIEHHPLARSRVVVDGAEIVVAWRPGPTTDTSAVSVAKGNPWVDVDLEVVWAELNDAEGLEHGERDRWGGSDLVGGSPRTAGTALSPTDVCEIITGCYGRLYRST